MLQPLLFQHQEPQHGSLNVLAPYSFIGRTAIKQDIFSTVADRYESAQLDQVELALLKIPHGHHY